MTQFTHPAILQSELTWSYTGNCGCSPPMSKYKTKDYPEFEVRVGRLRFEIRQFNRVISYGLLVNLGNMYYHFIADKHKPKAA